MIKSQVRRRHSIRGKCMGSGARLYFLCVNRHWDIDSTHLHAKHCSKCCSNINSFMSHNNPTRWVLPSSPTEAQRSYVICSRSHSLAVMQPGLTSQKAGRRVHALKPRTTLLAVDLSPLPLLLISCSSLGIWLISCPSVSPCVKWGH